MIKVSDTELFRINSLQYTLFFSMIFAIDQQTHDVLISHDNVKTTLRRRFDAIMTLLLRHVFAGRYPIARPWRWDLECRAWVQRSIIYFPNVDRYTILCGIWPCYHETTRLYRVLTHFGQVMRKRFWPLFVLQMGCCMLAPSHCQNQYQ